MIPIKATYLPRKYHNGKFAGYDEEKADWVLIVHIRHPIAVFITADGKLDCGSLDCFRDCSIQKE